MKNKIKRYVLNSLVLLDEAVNSMLLFGSPDETISSRAAKARNKDKAWGCVLCKFLDYLQKDHCKNSLEPYAGGDAIIKDD